MQKKPLTGWLILLIIILGPVTLGQTVEAFIRLNAACEPLIASHPSLLRAVGIYKLLMGASTFVSIYAAWVLYRRRPGSLGIAQAGLIIRAVLMIAAGFAEPFLAGLPADVTTSMYKDLVTPCGIVVLLTGVWYYYLKRSRRVSEIYAI